MYKVYIVFKRVFINKNSNKCVGCEYEYKLCIVTGSPIINEDVYKCSQCLHEAIRCEVNNYMYCPLCHMCL